MPDPPDNVDEATSPAPAPRTGAGQPAAGYRRPDELRHGDTGVFAGEWTLPGNGTNDGVTIPVGYVGVLTGRWNGWAVFTCTPHVAHTIVADHQHDRDTERSRLIRTGHRVENLDLTLDTLISPMHFDGADIIVDERAVTADPEAIHRIQPDQDGRYTVMCQAWCWTEVDPDHCDRIIGDTPPG